MITFGYSGGALDLSAELNCKNLIIVNSETEFIEEMRRIKIAKKLGDECVL